MEKTKRKSLTVELIDWFKDFWQEQEKIEGNKTQNKIGKG
jgi:hypothetical protein